MLVIEVTLYRCSECHKVVAEEGVYPAFPCDCGAPAMAWEELVVRDDDR